MKPVVLSWIGFVLGVVGLALAQAYNTGWLIAALSSLFWIVYAVRMKQWALLGSTTFYGLIDAHHWIVGL